MCRKKFFSDYDILVPPIRKPFECFSSDEAECFFGWYMTHIPLRISYLEKISKCSLNYTFDSLIGLWDWFLNNAKIENVSRDRQKDLKRYLKTKPLRYGCDFILAEDKQFSLLTEYIIRDISMYVGQLFVDYSPKIKWAYHTDISKDSFANIPLLEGFNDCDFSPPFPMQFEPTHMVRVVASNLFDNTHKKNDLYDLCVHWCKLIP